MSNKVKLVLKRKALKKKTIVEDPEFLLSYLETSSPILSPINKEYI